MIDFFFLILAADMSFVSVLFFLFLVVFGLVFQGVVFICAQLVYFMHALCAVLRESMGFGDVVINLVCFSFSCGFQFLLTSLPSILTVPCFYYREFSLELLC